MSKEFKFKIGADPEFNLEFNNKRLNSKETITNLFKNNKKFEDTGNGFKIKEKECGILGWDGHSSTGELRPNAENSPAKIAENIGGIFKELNNAGPLFEISTLSRAATLGGHIHLELPEKSTPKAERIRAIHKRIISFYLPIIMGENKTNIAIRIKGGYGMLCSNGAYRVEQKFTRPDGTPGFTYELRCPSAEWTVSEKIARSTLAYIGVVYHEIMKHPKTFEKTCKDIIIRTDKQGDAIQELAIAEYSPLNQNLLNKIKKYIKTFELYEEFKEEIDYILRPNQVLADKQKANFDIRIGWNLIKEIKEAPKRTILSEKAFKKKIKEKDLDTMSKLVNIAYNEDANVDIFAQRMVQTVAAFNLNLKKEYFLYGVRKGINGYIIANSRKSKIIGTDQIKTKEDENAIELLVTKMRIKAQNILGKEETYKKLNFTTGKHEEVKKEIIMIGIPYQDRIENKTRKLIEIIYDIEKGKIKEPKRNNKNLIDDTTLPNEEKGKIFKILNKIETEEHNINAAVADHTTDTATTEQRIHQLTQEEELIERETNELINNIPILPGEQVEEITATTQI